MPTNMYKGQAHHYPSTGDGVDAWNLDKQRIASGKAPKFSLSALKGKSMRNAVRSERKRIRELKKRGVASNGH